METAIISLYPNIGAIESTSKTSLDLFLNQIKNPPEEWINEVINVRRQKTKEELRIAKARLPSVTLSGLFSTRRDSALLEHSGFIGIDIDDKDPSEIKSILAPDEYVYSIFQSVSGNGACVLFKINGDRHRDAFYGISKYLYDQYKIIVDATCVNVSRARYISHDPEIYINDRATKKFTKYIPKKKQTTVKKHKVIYVQNEFEEIIKTIVDRGVDITHHYMDWLRVGFALANKFGESGRDYYHTLSSMSSKYDSRDCDAQYDNCLRSEKMGKSGVTLGTFYHFAKVAGIKTYSDDVREIIKITKSQRKSGVSPDATIETLKKHTDIDHKLIEEVVPQVDESVVIEDLSKFEQLEMEIRHNYNTRRNVVSRYVEVDQGDGSWMVLDELGLNTLWVKLMRSLRFEVNMSHIERVIMSTFTDEHNPFLHYIEQNIDRTTTGNFERLAATIPSEYGLTGDDAVYFMKKWYIGIISSIHGEYSPLMLVLAGSFQNAGKTEFFRRLLPASLKKYMAENKLDDGKDSEILMTQRLVIYDDEMGGKNKKDSKKLKDMLSKQEFTCREPYGKMSITMKRLAVLCGSTNDESVLNDPTGNRRIIPIHVSDYMDHDGYNAIDKNDLFMEAYHLWKSGERHHLTKDDIMLLNGKTSNFESTSIEEELLFQHFIIPKKDDDGRYFTTTSIKVILEKRSQQRLGLNNLGQVLLKHLKKKKKFYNESGKRVNGWCLYLKQEIDGYNDKNWTEIDDKVVAQNGEKWDNNKVSQQENVAKSDNPLPNSVITNKCEIERNDDSENDALF